MRPRSPRPEPHPAPSIPEHRNTAPSAGLPHQDRDTGGLEEHSGRATNPGDTGTAIRAFNPPSQPRQSAGSAWNVFPKQARSLWQRWDAKHGCTARSDCTQTLLTHTILPNFSYIISRVSHTPLLVLPRCIPGSQRFQMPC